MDKEKFAEKHSERIDDLASSCSTVIIKKVEQIIGRNLTTSERDELINELKTYCKVVVAMQLMDIIVNAEKEKKDESERPSNTLS